MRQLIEPNSIQYRYLLVGNVGLATMSESQMVTIKGEKDPNCFKILLITRSEIF